MQTKTCSKCKEVKDLDQFYKNNTGVQGYRADCKFCTRQRTNLYKKNNKESISKTNNLYYQKNKTKHNEYMRKHYKDNKEYYNAKSAKARAAKLNATPAWLTAEDWKAIEHKYLMAQEMTKLTGVKYVVDHIHPLQGKNICGLHVPSNLQVITETENSKKSNKHESD